MILIPINEINAELLIPPAQTTLAKAPLPKGHREPQALCRAGQHWEAHFLCFGNTLQISLSNPHVPMISTLPGAGQ